MTLHSAPKPISRKKRQAPPLRRITPVRKVNRKRRASEFQRCFGSRARVEWVKTLPCVVGLTCWGKMENAHVASGGQGRKADATSIVPLCHWHHHALHQHGRQLYASIDFDAAAADTERRWQEHLARKAS